MSSQVDVGVARALQSQLVRATPGGGTVYLQKNNNDVCRLL